MKDLLFLTLELSDGQCIEHIVLADKKDEAAEVIVANNKWRNPAHMYINRVSISISGVLIKGQYVGEYLIKQWL